MKDDKVGAFSTSQTTSSTLTRVQRWS